MGELYEEERNLIAELSAKLLRFQPRNKQKWDYYDGKAPLKDLGIALPSKAKDIKAVVGWPEIVVDALAERLEWQGWISTGQDISDLSRVFRDNDLDIEFAKATLDALVTGVGFLEVSAGGEGEPDVMIDAVPSSQATFKWDSRLNRMEAGLIQKTGANGEIYTTLHLVDRVVSVVKSRGDTVVDRVEHDWGRCGLIRVPNRVRAGDHHGTSEISSAIEYYTDHGIRTILGMEFNREYYTTPQRYLLNVTGEQLGLDEDASESEIIELGWKVAQNKALLVPPGDPDDPGAANIEAGEFQPASPAPYIDELRMLSQLVSAQSGVPATYLGFTHDNPPSADAIRASEARLVKRAELRQMLLNPVLRKDLAYVCQSILDGAPADLSFIASLDVKWRDASTPTLAATMDAMVKAAQAGIVSGQSSVVWSKIGFTESEQAMMRHEMQQQASVQRASLLATAASGVEDAEILALARADREVTETSSGSPPGSG